MFDVSSLRRYVDAKVTFTTGRRGQPLLRGQLTRRPARPGKKCRLAAGREWHAGRRKREPAKRKCSFFSCRPPSRPREFPPRPIRRPHELSRPRPSPRIQSRILRMVVDDDRRESRRLLSGGICFFPRHAHRASCARHHFCHPEPVRRFLPNGVRDLLFPRQSHPTLSLHDPFDPIRRPVAADPARSSASLADSLT